MTQKNEPASVKDILQDVLGSISRREFQDQISLEQLWQHTLGADAGCAVIEGFRDGRLTASVAGPADLFRMRMKRPGILRRLAAQRKDIKELVFRLGKKT